MHRILIANRNEPQPKPEGAARITVEGLVQRVRMIRIHFQVRHIGIKCTPQPTKKRSPMATGDSHRSRSRPQSSLPENLARTPCITGARTQACGSIRSSPRGTLAGMVCPSEPSQGSAGSTKKTCAGFTKKKMLRLLAAQNSRALDSKKFCPHTGCTVGENRQPTRPRAGQSESESPI